MPPITVLFVGFDPSTMDLGDQAADMAPRIQAGIEHSMDELRASGFDAEFLALREGDDGAVPAFRAKLRARAPDCVVIGAGVRLLAKHTVLFEDLVDATTALAPGARLAFNATPADAADAVRRRFPEAN